MLKHIVVGVWLLIIFTVLGIACYTSTLQPERITLLVHNEGIEPIKIYDPYGRIGTAFPGHSECLFFPRTYMGPVNFYLVNGNDEGTTPQIDPNTAKGWEVTVSTMPLRYAAISLVPNDEPCKR